MSDRAFPHLRGVVLGPSGFAAEGREWLAALELAGCAPSLEGARLGDLDCELAPEIEARVARCAARRRDPGAPILHHMLVPHFRPEPGVANVLATVFEAEGLPAGWADRLAQADVVLVKTDWNADAFARAGVDRDRIVVIPPAVDATPFTPRPTRRRDPSTRFRWLSVFDWSLRKGYDALLRAFGRTFEAHEAELLIKVVPHRDVPLAVMQDFCDTQVRRFAKGTPPEVRVTDALTTSERLSDLYASADGFVLASRGEGWGRPVHEAMLMRLPVVATRAGALQTLLPDETVGFPVATRTQPVSDEAAAETPWFRGLHWFEPDVDDLGARMREVFENPAAAAMRGHSAREHMLRLCDPRRVGAALRAALDRVTVDQHS